ncbi:ATP-binding protein [Endozoicomonas euniceicola]|uniref:ATP-binding protein n=1 Tax=Endozoicomonas euniceicola TaxID=1234143 RepID=A0ABY6GU81_9GAMM|nr:ATP-binding protein [Endozoicomonas euniceicola]UYM16341.1 ATP-binding protein [Endozoicomonas euniceicola]
MSELLEMHSVDGYAAGKIIGVRLDGNTNVNGANASGKTTLIKMAPTFYAVPPSTLQRQDANRRNFADYYLPNATSYLAFVYKRSDKFITVVITRKPGTSSLVYRFVHGRYKEQWFLQTSLGKPNFVITSNWRSHMTQAGYEVSRSVGYDDYRLIIQSNLRYTSSNRKKNDLINQYRRLYSYPTNGRDMSNIHLLANAVLQRKPSMEAIKSILESVLINQGFIDNGEFGLDLPSKKVNEWIENRNAYLSVDGQRDNIIDLENKQGQFDQMRSRLSEIKNLSEQRKKQLLEEQESLTETLSQHDSDIAEYNKQIKYIRNSTETEIQLVTAKMTEQQKTIQGLELRKNTFEKEDIHAQRALASRKGELKELLQQAEKYLTDLQDGVKDIVQHYRNARNSAESEAQGKKSQLTGQRDSYKLDYQKYLLELKENLLHERSILTDKKSEEDRRVQRQIEKFIGDIGLLQGKLENVGPAPEITEQREDLKNEQEQINSNLEDTRQDIELAQELLKQAKVQLDQCISEKQALQNAITQTRDALELARERFTPKDGSLLSFLRANVPNWADNISRVIQPELLLRRDLHPRLIEHEHAFYGVDLDISGIEMPEFANDEALQAEIRHLDEHLAKLLTKLDKHEELEALRKKEHIEAEKSVAREKHHLKLCKRQFDDVNNDITELNVQAEHSIIKQRKDIEKQKSDLEEQKRLQQTRLKKLQDEYDSAYKNLDAAHHEAENNAIATRNEQLAMVDSEIASVDESLDIRLSEINEEEADQMRKEGVDERAINRARQETKKAREDHADAIHATNVIEQYTEFMETHWPEHEVLSVLVADLKAEILKLEKERNESVDKLQSVINKLNSDKEKVDEKLEIVNHDLSMLTNSQTRMRNTALPDSAPKLTTIHTAAYLIQRWQDVQTESNKLCETGCNLFKTIHRAFTRNERSRPFEFFQRLSSENRDTDERWESEERWAVAAPYLIKYLNDSHKSNADLLRDSAKMLGQNLSDFSAKLERIHKQVRTLGNQVTEQTESICGDFEALDRLSVKVFSNVDKLDYYASLKSFALIHNDWVATSLNSLPNEEYLHRLDGIKTMMEKTGLSVKVQNSFGIEVRVIDQGVEKIARRDKDMEGISSNGVSYLIIILIYNALVNLLRGGREDVLVWPIDELKDFDLDNTRAMVRQLNGDNIHIFSAFPDPDPAVLKYFQHLYQAKGRKDSNKRKLVRFAEIDVPSASDDLNAVMAIHSMA